MRRNLMTMYVALAAMLAVSQPITHAQQWVEGSAIGINPDNSKGPIAIFIGGHYSGWNDAYAIPKPMPPGQWHVVDLPSLPADAKAAFLSGLLIITHPTTMDVTCNLTATFRAPGSTWHEANYQLQTLEAGKWQGVRSSAATWVPVKNKQVEFFYTMTAGCPSLINLSLQAYVR